MDITCHVGGLDLVLTCCTHAIFACQFYCAYEFSDNAVGTNAVFGKLRLYTLAELINWVIFTA